MRCYKISIKKFFFIFVTLVLFTVLLNAGAAKAVTENEASFYIDQEYDSEARQILQATLVKTSPSIYFYVGKKWWDAKGQNQKDAVLSSLDSLSNEFDKKIYPTLTSVFGGEWKPGIDNDNKITVLFHEMGGGVGGYVRSSDEYSKLQEPSSNQREMVYLPIEQITSPKLNGFLAHEFTHLIVFNQKERIQGVQEEVWLNEARAEYAITILGYNNVFEGSNLQRRVNDFLQRTDDSLTEWQNTKYDYGIINLFTNYLVDQYGLEILSDSLKLKSIGIGSLNQTLSNLGVKESFEEAFTNWTIAITVNNCFINYKYCYLNNHLKNLKVNPELIFLPVSGSSSLNSTNFTKNWSANLHKIVGGNGDLKLVFSSPQELDFKVSYITVDKNNSYALRFLEINQNRIGEVNIENFSSQYNALIIIPSLQSKKIGFNGAEASYPYMLEISSRQISQHDTNLIQQLLAQIESLKNQIANLQAGQLQDSCKITENLYFGISNKNQVTCLQSFLKSQRSAIYPEGLVTGNFGILTKNAVIRFQEKYASEILANLGLAKGTGFVGVLTRAKINQLLEL